jgi:hypothetical protein
VAVELSFFHVARLRLSSRAGLRVGLPAGRVSSSLSLSSYCTSSSLSSSRLWTYSSLSPSSEWARSLLGHPLESWLLPSPREVAELLSERDAIFSIVSICTTRSYVQNLTPRRQIDYVGDRLSCKSVGREVLPRITGKLLDFPSIREEAFVRIRHPSRVCWLSA